jgi:hypothetical protein
MGYLQQEMIKEQIMCEDMRAEIIKLEERVASLRRLADASAIDASILLPMVQHFYTRSVERGDYNEIVEAAKYAIDDTGILPAEVVDILTRLGFTVDENDFNREYQVSMTIPVYLTVTVSALDEETAQEIAPDLVADEGLHNYHLDWDTMSVDIDYVEEI